MTEVIPELDEPVPSTTDISGGVEALLLLASEPMSETELAQAVHAPVAVVADCLTELVAFYDETGRGFELREVGGGWRYYTRQEHAELITDHLLDGAQSKLSQAALETLAVVAYQQPISRARISAVRGVNVDGVVRTLVARGLIAEAGHDKDSAAIVFTTTGHFLERMGLRSLDDLPPIAHHLPEATELEAELSALADSSSLPDPVDGPLASAPDASFPEPAERPSGAAADTSDANTDDDGVRE